MANMRNEILGHTHLQTARGPSYRLCFLFFHMSCPTGCHVLPTHRQPDNRPRASHPYVHAMPGSELPTWPERPVPGHESLIHNNNISACLCVGRQIVSSFFDLRATVTDGRMLCNEQ